MRAVDGGCLGDLARLEPFGTSNPEPLFLTRNVRVRDRRIVGEHHLKLVLEQDGRTIQAIGFGMGDVAVAAGDQLDVLYSVMANEWNGNVSAELRLRDLRPDGRRMNWLAYLDCDNTTMLFDRPLRSLHPDRGRTARMERDDAMLNSKEVAHILDLSPDTVNEFARKSILPAVKKGRQWRFRRRDIASFKRQLRGLTAA